MERAIGEWIREEAGPGPLVVAGWETLVVAYRAEARFLPIAAGTPTEALTAARAAGASYMVIYLRSRAPIRGHLAPALMRAGAIRISRFAAQRDGKTYTWLVVRCSPKKE